jgi:HTH-type transcriptional regulator/antitoxin HipB
LSSISKIWQKLSDPEYRKAFVASQINIGIPYQIRALAKARGWTQGEVGERCGMPQPRISELMRPGRTKPNLRTLLRVAAGFDCGLLVRFVTFSELACWSDSFDPESFNAVPFDEDSLPRARRDITRSDTPEERASDSAAYYRPIRPIGPRTETIPVEVGRKPLYPIRSLTDTSTMPPREETHGKAA